MEKDVSELITHGIERLTTSRSIDELHAAAAATLGELAFLQLGFVPKAHCDVESVPLNARNWKMNPVRTVQYVQTDKQREVQKRISQLKEKERGK